MNVAAVYDRRIFVGEADLRGSASNAEARSRAR
jgi:hypothetical protein